MFDFIEKVVYINLEYREDRKQSIEKELLKYFSSEKIQRFNAFKTDFGAIGCTQSHIGALELAIKEEWSNVLIVEDDSIWSNFNDGYSKLIELTKNKFDVIMLGSSNAEYYSDYKVKTAQSGNAYLVSKYYYSTLLNNLKEGLKKLIETHIKSLYMNDQYWKLLQKTDNWYCVIPSIMIQREDYSDIEKKHVNYTYDFNNVTEINTKVKQETNIQFPRIKQFFKRV